MKFLILFLLSTSAFALTDRSIFVTSSVNAGATSNTDSAAIPTDATISIRDFGFASQVDALIAITGLVDMRSDTATLMWGTVGSFETIRIIAITGNTVSLDVNRTFTGDGSKFFRLQRKNNSGGARVSAAWATIVQD